MLHSTIGDEEGRPVGANMVIFPDRCAAAQVHFVKVAGARLRLFSPNRRLAETHVVNARHLLRTVERGAFDGINLIVNPAFTGDQFPWTNTDGNHLLSGRDFSDDWKPAEGHAGYFGTQRGVALHKTVFEIVYDDPDFGQFLPVEPGAWVHWGCRVAGHRNRIRLFVRYYDAAGKMVGEQAASVDPHKAGGLHLEDYDRIVRSGAAPDDAATMRLSMEVRQQPEAHDSYVFFTDAVLFTGRPTDRDRLAPRPAHFKGMREGLANGSGRVFEAAINPRTFPERGGLVELTPLDGKGPAVPIAAVDPAEELAVTLDGLRGPVVQFTVKGGTDCLVFAVDGEEVAVRDWGKPVEPGVVGVACDTRFFDGNVHHVAITDRTGLVVHFESLERFPAELTPWYLIQENTMPPFPAHLAPVARQRLRAMEAFLGRLAEEGDGDAQAAWRRANMARLYETLVRGFAINRTFFPLRFARPEEPVVSVVVPVHDNYAVTFHCLCALLFAEGGVPFEVIVVDDGSTDGTGRRLAEHEGFTVVTHERARGFVHACNAGAARARGRHIVFLNNDTEPTARWLAEMVATLERLPRAGIVGAKLIYPDGRLQEAGGLVWNTGDPWNYGRLGNPSDPRYSYAREVDYVSGAALMIRRAVWEAVGGFSAELAPAYFEDTDLCFKAREAGWRTLYQPLAEVVHFEGLSNGTDGAAEAGMKRFQEINRPKFKRKWSRTFLSFGAKNRAPDLEKDRGIVGRVLFIDWQLPRPDMDAGSYAALQEIRLVQALGMKVTLLPLNLAYLGKYVEELQRIGVEILYAPFVFSLEDFMADRGREFDAFYVTRYPVAEQALPLIKRYAPNAKVLYCNADLMFLRELRAARASGDAEAAELAMQTRERELAVSTEVDVTLSYNDVEHAVILSHNGIDGKVMRAPWVQEVVPRTTGFEETEGLFFLGGFNHPPNTEGIEYFATAVLPLLAIRRPDIRLHVYGSRAHEYLSHLSSDTLVIEGFVPALEPVLARHRVFVSPLLSGAGVKGKVFNALAHGIPSILSPISVEGIPLREDHEILMARTPDEWVDRIIRLYDDAERWRTLSERSQAFIARHYSFEEGLSCMLAAFEAAGLYLPRPEGLPAEAAV